MIQRTVCVALIRDPSFAHGQWSKTKTCECQGCLCLGSNLCLPSYSVQYATLSNGYSRRPEIRTERTGNFTSDFKSPASQPVSLTVGGGQLLYVLPRSKKHKKGHVGIYVAFWCHYLMLSVGSYYNIIVMSYFIISC
jgi:hypothetical protein